MFSLEMLNMIEPYFIIYGVIASIIVLVYSIRLLVQQAREGRKIRECKKSS